MILSIHQPQYLPWLGYFEKIDRSEIFVFLDNVQFKKNEWQNRNRIKTAMGNQWLTVPVIHKFPQKIVDVEINDTVSWERKHLNALSTNYSKAPFYDEHIPVFQSLFSQEWKRLVDINIYVIEYISKALGLTDKQFVKASDLDLKEGNTERLVDICKQLGADVYLSGKDGANYLDISLFKKENINVIFQDYKHPSYSQLYSEFEPFLSIIDLMLNCGPKSLTILKGNG